MRDSVGSPGGCRAGMHAFEVRIEIETPVTVTIISQGEAPCTRS